MKKNMIISAAVVSLITIALILFFALHKKSAPAEDPNNVETKVKKQAEEMMSGIKNKGEFLFKEKSFLARAAIYEKMLKNFPASLDTKKKLADIYYSLATMAYGVGDVEKAKEYFGKASEVAPDHSDPDKLRDKLK